MVPLSKSARLGVGTCSQIQKGVLWFAEKTRFVSGVASGAGACSEVC